ncbi:MAG TPA: substrate-binding domain-containing protein [Elusimicrobiota bacterium]|nr:substrate-binding domain-containing protein [Elusimicrobiota bacterium]
MVGVGTHPDPDLKEHYFSETFRGLRQALGRRSRCSLVVNPPPGRAVDALILLAPTEDDPLLRRARRDNIPTVLVNGCSHGFPCVDLDNITAAFAAVSHLLRLGHRRVGMINGKMETANGRDRYEGYRRALAAHGISLDETLVTEGRFSRAGGRTAMERLLSLPHRPTAVFAANDHMALGALEAARHAGRRVPADVAVVGFDDIAAAASSSPSLTTVRQPLFQMAREAANLLAPNDPPARREGPGNPSSRRILLQGTLVVRKSCGAFPEKFFSAD